MDGYVHFRFTMSCAQECSFKLRGRQPDALVDHGAMKAAERGGVGFGRVGVVGDRIVCEEPGPHGADAIDRERNAGTRGLLGYAFGNGLRGRFKVRVDLSPLLGC